MSKSNSNPDYYTATNIGTITIFHHTINANTNTYTNRWFRLETEYELSCARNTDTNNWFSTSTYIYAYSNTTLTIRGNGSCRSC